MDVGTRGEQGRLAQSPATQASPQSPGHLNLHQQQLQLQPQHSYSDASFLPPVPQIHSHPYTAANYETLAADHAPSADPFAQSVDPDDFYRNYRGVQTANAALLPSPIQDMMASPALPSNRHPPAAYPPSNGSTPRAPVSSPTARSGASRPAARSVSNTIDDRAAGVGARLRAATSTAFDGRPNPPSVKDLKKRFDQSTAQNQAANRKASTRLPVREAPGSATGSYAALRTGTARDAGGDGSRSGSRTSQRPKYVPEDQLSSNSQSFASRINRPPRNAVAPSTRASKLPTSPQGSPHQARNGLLFGEILPENNDSVTAGFGINETRPRRTSESSAQNPARQHLRSHSNPDLEPPSPTDWYRGAPSQPNVDSSEAPRVAKGHSRAYSDAIAAKPAPSQSQRAPSHARDKPRPARGISPASRLPVSIRKVNSPPQPGSAASTRGRTSRQHHTAPATRAKTPTSRSNTPTSRARTPTHAPGSSRKAPPSHISTPANGRLSAYVNPGPPPKLSPSLRSSRPRQSAIDRAQSPNKSSQRGTSKADESSGRRRKISVGPIDFAQRRETIKLAYSKSIRESQAKEASRAAAERRRKEMETVARIKLEAEAAALAAQAAQAEQSRLTTPMSPPESKTILRPDEQLPLKITTNLPISRPTIKPVDSPTLGIPGSFPSMGSPPLDEDEAPQSAISTTTAITEFDVEPQTEAPTQESTTTIDEDLAGSGQTNALGVLQTTPRRPTPRLYKRASYQDPFEDDDALHDEAASLKISLDASANPSPQLTPTRSEFDPEPQTEPPVPGSFYEEYEPQPFQYPSRTYETTVTILGPGPEFRPMDRDEPGIADLGSEPEQIDAISVSNISPNELPGVSVSDKVTPEDEYQHVKSMQSLENFYVGPRLRDNIAALRDSTFTSSDQEGSYEAIPSSAEFQKTPETAHSLSVPALLSPNRLSQNSVWTDFSFGSSDERDGKSPALQSRELDVRESRSTTKPVQPAGDYSHQESSFEDLGASQPTSPLDTFSAEPHMVDESLRGRHRLPELEIDAGFSVPYPHAGAPKEVDPDYDLNEGSYGADTRRSSYFHDESEELTPALSTPHSAGELSLETADSHSFHKMRPLEMQGPSDQEKKRLKQRQMVIRELIDTEAVFIRDMSVVEEIYKGTAEACPKLDSKTIKLVFRNTDEIINFHSAFLSQLKEGVSTVYAPKGRRSPLLGADASSRDSDSASLRSIAAAPKTELDNEKDRLTCIGPLFAKNIEKLKAVHEAYLRSSDQSTKRLLQIQEDPTVKVWLNECNEVAKDLTSAWNLDSLLIKPMQRITKYPDIITHLLKHTPSDHPDRESLTIARTVVINTIDDINKTKKNFELVGQIVGRKRKESDVRAGLARAFGKRVDKIQASNNRPPEDEEYTKLHEKFGDDYLRLQVVLRDVEFYTRTVSTYVHEFLQYLSSMELVMRLQPSKFHAHLESKWVQFNVSMRDIEKIALEKHLSDVRKHVIEPFEQVIRCYGNPSLAMKKRAKRRLDYERYIQLKANGKKVDKQLIELVEQYEALNDTLKKELPKLSALTAKVGNICLGKFVSIQTAWYGIWQEKVKMPLQDASRIPEFSDIVSTFQREFREMEEEAMSIGILNPSSLKGRTSQSTTDDTASTFSKSRSRPGDLLTPRDRGLSVNSDHYPTLPTPDFGKRNSGSFAISPTALPSPGHYYRDYYSGINTHSRKNSGSPITPEPPSASRSVMPTVRPSTGRSYDSGGAPRQSSDSAVQLNGSTRRDSNSTYNSAYPGQETRRLSGLFHSALPLPDAADESQRSSRASSRDRAANSGYTIMWLAASLFEFNIETTKHEAGYPYLTYQAGEIFDVIAEKGELWLAKNQDDPHDQVGWIWSKHFAKLADS
ncbi:hypothetical protein GQ53DRAFT_786173 [Thozetella sp. PMI_491]|nr:hypothetical protein GQ53DRAFT_786173 [Thozetella sp. PMI_491]